MPISTAATDVMRMFVNDRFKISSQFIFTLPYRWYLDMNKEDRIVGYILRKTINGHYEDFAHVQYCGQLGYTLHLHGPISGIPLEELKELVGRISDIEEIQTHLNVPIAHMSENDPNPKGLG